MAYEIKDATQAIGTFAGGDPPLGGAQVITQSGFTSFQRTSVGVYVLGLQRPVEPRAGVVVAVPKAGSLAVFSCQCLGEIVVCQSFDPATRTPFDCPLFDVVVFKEPRPEEDPGEALPIVPPPTPVVPGGGAGFSQTFGSLNIAGGPGVSYLVPGCNNTAEGTEVCMVLTRAVSINVVAAIHNEPNGNGSNVTYQMFTGNPLAALIGPALVLATGGIGDVIAATPPIALAAGTRLGVRANRPVAIGSGHLDVVFTIGGDLA
jgi:hypothetical protein